MVNEASGLGHQLRVCEMGPLLFEKQLCLSLLVQAFLVKDNTGKHQSIPRPTSCPLLLLYDAQTVNGSF